MNVKQAYKILDISENATMPEITQAYRDLAQIWHPDRQPQNERIQKKALEKMKELNAAYDLICSYLKNKDYQNSQEETSRQTYTNKIVVCPQCGAKNRIPDNGKSLDAKCGVCGSFLFETEDNQKEDEESKYWKPCGDGTCIGRIDNTGRCRICEKTYDEGVTAENRRKEQWDHDQTQDKLRTRRRKIKKCAWIVVFLLLFIFMIIGLRSPETKKPMPPNISSESENPKQFNSPQKENEIVQFLDKNKLSAKGGNGKGWHLFLNGKRIYETDDEFFSFEKVFTLSDGYAVLVSEVCAGNSCSPKSRFLTIKPSKDSIKSSKYFKGGEIAESNQNGDIITLLISREYKKEIYDRIIYKKGNVNIKEKAVDNWTNKTGNILSMTEVFKMEGRYPQDILADIDVKTTIMDKLKIDAKTYDFFMDNIQTAGPSKIENSALTLLGCLPHSCVFNESLLQMRTDGGITLLILNCDKKKGFYYTNISQHSSSLDRTSLSHLKDNEKSLNETFKRTCYPITIQHKYLDTLENVFVLKSPKEDKYIPTDLQKNADNSSIISEPSRKQNEDAIKCENIRKQRQETLMVLRKLVSEQKSLAEKGDSGAQEKLSDYKERIIFLEKLPDCDFKRQ